MRPTPDRFPSWAVSISNAVGYLLAAAPPVYVDSKLSSHVVYGARYYEHSTFIAPLAALVFLSTLILVRRGNGHIWVACAPLIGAAVLTVPILAQKGARQSAGEVGDLPHLHLVTYTLMWLVATLVWLGVRGPAKRAAQRSSAAFYLAVLAPGILWYLFFNVVLERHREVVPNLGEWRYLHQIVWWDAITLSAFWWLVPTRLIYRARFWRPQKEDIDMAPGSRTQVFVSYSHQDSDWLMRLHVHLKPLIRRGVLELWDDSKIKPGDVWRDEIEKALCRASVAVLLVSADFLASDFVADNELPPLLDKAASGGVRIMPVIVGPCLFESHPELSKYQAVNSPGQPLAGMQRHEAEAALTKLAKSIAEYAGG